MVMRAIKIKEQRGLLAAKRRWWVRNRVNKQPEWFEIDKFTN